jgi:hypothetical protein
LFLEVVLKRRSCSWRCKGYREYGKHREYREHREHKEYREHREYKEYREHKEHKEYRVLTARRAFYS